MDFAAIFLAPERLRQRTDAFAEAVAMELVQGQSSSFAKSVTHELLSDTEAEIKIGAPGVYAEWGKKGGRDIKMALLSSPKAKISKTGARYMSIPMRDGWVTASSNGKPWLTKDKPGLGRIKRVLGLWSDFMVSTRPAHFGKVGGL